MALDLVDYERKAHEAVQAFWGNRKAAKQKQIELKSQVGPSFENNFNNRTEEAIGTRTTLH